MHNKHQVIWETEDLIYQLRNVMQLVKGIYVYIYARIGYDYNQFATNR